MPTTYELVSGATDLSSAASWSPATAPSGWTNGDSVIIRKGSQTVNAGLTAITVTLASVKVFATFKGNLGDGNPVVFGGLVTSFILEGGGGNFYIATSCTKMQVKGTLGGMVSLSTGTITTLIANNARMYVGSAAVVTNLTNVNSDIEAIAGTGFTTMFNRSGTLKSSRDAATAGMLAGKVEWNDDAAVSGTLSMYGGEWNHKGGNIDKLLGYAGNWHTTGNYKDMTISTQLDKFPGFTFSDKAGSGAVTLPSTINEYDWSASLPPAVA